MTDNEMNKNQALKEQEAYFLQLVEEKQLELIWHPDRREKCEITFTYEHRAWAVYVYREDCPMSAFREYAMFMLFMFYADCLADDYEDWKPAAAMAVNYLCKLPEETRNRSLEFAYTRITQWYEASGNPKAEWYRKQAELYRLYADDINPWDAVRTMDTMGDDKLFDYCLYILRYIVEQGCFGEDTFYSGWQRDQYELVEEVLDKAVKRFAEDAGNTTLNRSFIYFLKGIYLKRTRRFELAETVWKAYFELPHIEEACFTPSFFYALWGECCLHRMDEAHAKVHFLKVRKEEEPLVWEYVQSLLNKKEASAEDLNEAYWQIVIDACCQNNVTPQSLKESIDAFFAPPEIEDDEEEEDEEEQDEEVDEEDNGEEECGYTFDDWYADAEGGDSLAQLVVGHLYYMGGYVTRNYRLAREWFYLSALQGNAVAQMNLAYMYAHGYGTEIDEPEAAKWRQKAETNQGEEMQEYGNLILTDE